MTDKNTARKGFARAALAALRRRAPATAAQHRAPAVAETTNRIREMQDKARSSSAHPRVEVGPSASARGTQVSPLFVAPSAFHNGGHIRRLSHAAFRLSAAGAGVALLVAMFASQALGGSSSDTKAGEGTSPRAPLAEPPATGGSSLAMNSQKIPNIASDAEVGGGEASNEGSVPGASIEAAKAAPARVGRFDLPLKKWFMVTDRYGAPRGKGVYHGGIDLALDDLPRSLVFAACEGKVATVAHNGVLGNHVVIDCGEDWSTVYGHLSTTNVVVGQVVQFEEVLGISGNTGYSTGEHLHFEIRWQGFVVNPEKYLDFHIAPGAPLTYDKRDANGELITSTSPTPTATHTPTPTPTPDFSIIPPHLRPTVAPTKTPIPTPTPIPPTPTITPTPTVTPRAGQLGG